MTYRCIRPVCPPTCDMCNDAIDEDTVRFAFCEQLFYANWDEDEAIVATAEVLGIPSSVVQSIVYPARDATA